MKSLTISLCALATFLPASCERQAAVGGTGNGGTSRGTYAIVDIGSDPQKASFPVTFSEKLPTDFGSAVYRAGKIVFKWMEPGTFRMGQARLAAPIHPVTLTKGFYIGLFELTQNQWEQVMGPSSFRFPGNPAHPVESVSWEDIRGASEAHDWPLEPEPGNTSFMGRLSMATAAEFRFDLPSEAQWEYACRAGTETKWSFGDSFDGADDAIWSADNSDGETREAGTRKPNPWGLFDLHGNVAEWCLDRHGFYPREAVDDPAGSAHGRHRVWRGGGWDVAPFLAQSALRSGGPAAGRYPNVGFRPVLYIAN
ncbi:MAG: formylglycine-generating enzyme family protein [Verrucomicrobiales bacterium]